MDFGTLVKHILEQFVDFENKTPDEMRSKLVEIRNFLIKYL
jgi:hypothetical protein